MKKGLIVANWKLNGSLAKVVSFALDLKTIKTDYTDVVFAPPSIYLPSVSNEGITLGAQDVSQYEKGAYTGELSANMLSEFCQYIMVGHSERRQLFFDTNDVLIKKVKQVLAAGAKPIFCIGETLNDKEKDQTINVLKDQLNPVLDSLDYQLLQNLVIAYEPVWAIGTNKTPSIEEINEIHQNIRSILAQKDDTIASKLHILYGGSVNSDNAQAIFSCEHVDGALVGGASLTIDSFRTIIQAYK